MQRLLPIEEHLAGLAEEAAELAQAALKLRRVYDGANPTPTEPEVAEENLYEEVADVLLYIKLLQMNNTYIDQLMSKKYERWCKRMGDAKK